MAGSLSDAADLALRTGRRAVPGPRHGRGRCGELRRRMEDCEAPARRGCTMRRSRISSCRSWPSWCAMRPSSTPSSRSIGPDILLWDSSFIVKEPGDGKRVSWHQDLTYWGLEPTEGVVSIWLALAPATVESGAMKMIPGSHLGPIRRHRDTFAADNILTRGQEIAEDDRREPRRRHRAALPARCRLHHGRIFHGSQPNRSADRRIGFNAQYIAARVRQVVGRWDSATLVRGRDSLRAFRAGAAAGGRVRSGLRWVPGGDGEAAQGIHLRRRQAASDAQIPTRQLLPLAMSALPGPESAPDTRTGIDAGMPSTGPYSTLRLRDGLPGHAGEDKVYRAGAGRGRGQGIRQLRCAGAGGAGEAAGGERGRVAGDGDRARGARQSEAQRHRPRRLRPGARGDRARAARRSVQRRAVPAQGSRLRGHRLSHQLGLALLRELSMDVRRRDLESPAQDRARRLRAHDLAGARHQPGHRGAGLWRADAQSLEPRSYARRLQRRLRRRGRRRRGADGPWQRRRRLRAHSRLLLRPVRAEADAGAAAGRAGLGRGLGRHGDRRRALALGARQRGHAGCLPRRRCGRALRRPACAATLCRGDQEPAAAAEDRVLQDHAAWAADPRRVRGGGGGGGAAVRRTGPRAGGSETQLRFREGGAGLDQGGRLRHRAVRAAGRPGTRPRARPPTRSSRRRAARSNMPRPSTGRTICNRSTSFTPPAGRSRSSSRPTTC